MDRSVAQGRPPDRAATSWTSAHATRRRALASGGLLALVAAAIYLAGQTDRYYDHFVWQASAFLEGQAAIRHPVGPSAGSLGNRFFQDVLPVAPVDGIPRGLLPFPPLPAVLLIPFVAVWGLATDDQAIFGLLAGIDVAACWWMLGRLAVRPSIRWSTTIFFAFGTVFWYAANVATTWYQAHIVAVGLLMGAIGLALGADPAADVDDPAKSARAARSGLPSRPARLGTTAVAVDGRQFAAGLLLGLAATARLTVVFALPFLLLVGAGGGAWRRGWSAAIGAALPVGLLLAYNVAATGEVVHPAYDYLYRLETAAYPSLGYHAEWSLEDPRYVPQNAAIMFLATPDVFPTTLPDALATDVTPVCQAPGAARGLFDVTCPLAVPRDTGMSVLLTSPAYLLLLPVLRRYGRSRVVTGAAIAIVLIVLVNLMHFSQGWVQFGYRFSNDAAPLALVLVALGAERLVASGRAWAWPVVGALIALSIAVNGWGLIWGSLLGW